MEKKLLMVDQMPAGALQPLVKPHSIDDVPVLALTLHSTAYDANMIRQVAVQLDPGAGGKRPEPHPLAEPARLEGEVVRCIGEADRVARH